MAFATKKELERVAKGHGAIEGGEQHCKRHGEHVESHTMGKYR
jgi:hypothetical protein